MNVQRALRFAVAAVILSVFLSPWQRDLFVGDETKYSKVVREMRAGSFFLPTLEGSPFTHKPPLHFWVVGLLTHVFGVYSTWSFVLPSLLGFVALLFLVAKIARETDPDRAAIAAPLSAFVCGTSVMIWGSAQTARMDLEFTALLALGALLVRRFLDRDDRRALLLAGLAYGVATIVKGPMAPVMAIALLLFEWLRHRKLPRGPYFGALGLMALIPILWLVPSLMLGGSAFAQEIFYKQTVRRAVGAWVHKAPPWFYVTHAPGTLFPWFLLFVISVVAVYRMRDERAKFFISWVLSVFVPYTLLSSKLDVYMMAMVPPVALLIGRFVTMNSDSDSVLRRWGHRFNLIMIALLALIGVAGFIALGRYVPAEYAALAQTLPVKMLFIVMAVTGIVAALVAWRGGLVASTVMVGSVLVVTLAYVAIALMPVANAMSSTRPLITALAATNVPGNQIALFTSPHLWSRDFPVTLEDVHYASSEKFADPAFRPELVATSRKYAKDIAPQLAAYDKVGEVQMIGKWFDLYRRRH
jgi:4-amino-4-deoxy-L-arabinose transferase-like glycosyltransferase